MGAPLSRAEFRSKLLESRQERPAVRQPRPQEQRSPRKEPNVLSIDNRKPKHAGGRPDHKIVVVMEFFREKLAEGPRPSTELARELLALGINQRLANRARQKLGITAYQQSGKWWLRPSPIQMS